jgi:hypothetical protein
MKVIYGIAFLLLLSCSNEDVYSQYFTAGIYSGMNFSDIHGQDFGGKWSSKPGPSEGFSLGYSFNRSFGFQTGLEYSSVYYEYRPYSYPYYPIYYVDQYMPLYKDQYIVAPYLSNSDQTMNISFLRLPLLFSVTIPSVVKLNMRAGIYYSFRQNYSMDSYYYSPALKPKKVDFGYIFSAGISYPFSKNLEASLNINYIEGRKQFLEYYNYRHGSSEFVLGIDYKFLNKENTDIGSEQVKDSSSNKVTVTYRGGFNVSWNAHSVDGKKYSPISGPAVGFTVNIPLGYGLFFITGASFERVGYAMKDSSTSFYSYMKNDNYQMYYVDTKVQMDYAVIPFLMSFPIGRSQKIFFNTGPWLGLRLKARNFGVAYTEYRSESGYSVNKTDVYDDLNRLIKGSESGWLFGGGVNIPLPGQQKIQLALQYTTNFKNVINKSTAEQQNPDSESLVIRNKTISFMIGFTLPPSKN